MKYSAIICSLSLSWLMHIHIMNASQQKTIVTQEFKNKCDTLSDLDKIQQQRAQQQRNDIKTHNPLFCLSFPKIFPDLPSELTRSIFYSIINEPEAELIQTAQTINNLTLLCKSMNEFINDKKNTLLLIKELSTQFTCSNEYAARVLGTKSAGERFLLQKAFEDLCGSDRYAPIPPQISKYLTNNDIDINFTYGCNAETQLMIAVKTYFNSYRKPQIIKWLLENGADTINPKPVIFDILENYSEMANQIFSYFLDIPKIDINHCYNPTRIPGREISVLFSALIPILGALENRTNPHPTALKRVQMILAKGANPALVTAGGLTALDMIQACNIPELTTMVTNALAHNKNH